MAELITLDGQVLNGTDALGEWKTNSIENWWGSPEQKGEEEDRPGVDGDFDLEVQYAPRYVTITGRVRAESHFLLHQAMGRFSALVKRRALLQVSGHGVAQWAQVKRNGALSIDPVTDTFAHWQARLKCSDPRKYGAAADFVRTNGTVAVRHRGTYDALPTIVVRGSAANGYRINGPGGKQYKVSMALVTGIPHRIEFRDGLLRVDGNLVPDGVDRADVWPVPAGDPTDFDINVLSGGTAEATITVTDTYI